MSATIIKMTNAILPTRVSLSSGRARLPSDVPGAVLIRGAIDRLPDPGQLRAALMKRAADIRRVLTRREPAVRRVLQSVITEPLEFAPFNDGQVRGYQFTGTGSYGEELLGDTCPTSNGGPNGIWQWDVFPMLPFDGLATIA